MKYYVIIVLVAVSTRIVAVVWRIIRSERLCIRTNREASKHYLLCWKAGSVQQMLIGSIASTSLNCSSTLGRFQKSNGVDIWRRSIINKFNQINIEIEMEQREEERPREGENPF